MNVKKLIKAVRKLAKENPYYKYPKVDVCRYNEDEHAPACIFGQAALLIGEPIPWEFEGNLISSILEPVETSHLDAVNWCRVVQSEQDRQTPWGDAVKLADEICPLNETTKTN